MAFVTYEECDYVFGKWFNDIFGRRPRHVLTASAFSRLGEVVAPVISGGGYSIVPEHAVRPEVADGKLGPYRPAGGVVARNPGYAVARPGWQSRGEIEPLVHEIRRIAAVPLGHP